MTRYLSFNPFPLSPANVIGLMQYKAFALLIDKEIIAMSLAGVVCVLSGQWPLTGDAPHPFYN